MSQNSSSGKTEVRQFACPLMGKATIGMARCQDICKQPRTNEEKCSVLKCTSPFRLCRRCVITNPAHPNIVSDPATGLCKACAKLSPERLGAERALANIGRSAEEGGNVVHMRQAANDAEARPASIFRPAHGDENLPVISATTDPATIMGREVFMPTLLVDPLPDQPRIEFDEADELDLATSIRENGQLMAGMVVPFKGRYQLIDGERRLRACTRIGYPFKAIPTDVRTYAEQKKRSILVNFNRKSHSPIETALAMRFLQKQIRTETKQRGETSSENQVRIRIASMLGCSIGNVNNHLKLLDDLDSRVIELLRPQKNRRPLRMTVALELTPFRDNPDQQFKMAWEITRQNMQLPAARVFIAQSARKMKVVKGRGLERKPADWREILVTALFRFRHVVSEVLEQSEFELRQMFRRAPTGKFQDLLQMAREERDRAVELVEVLEAVQENMAAVPSAAE